MNISFVCILSILFPTFYLIVTLSRFPNITQQPRRKAGLLSSFAGKREGLFLAVFPEKISKRTQNLN